MGQSGKMPALRFSAMSEAEISDADTSDWIAVLPLGATEQHGPHLPLETDTMIANGIVARLREKLPTQSKVTFLDAEPVGYSPEHLDFEGSLSLTHDEAIARWIAIGEKLNRMGIRKLVLLNAHGGNSPLMTIVATELRVRFNMLCVATSWTRFGLPDGFMAPHEAAIDIHGGEIETSVMLALHPERVDMSKAEVFASRQADWLANNRFLSAYGRHAFGWKMQDLNTRGVVGNAKAATAEKGNLLLDHAVAGLIILLGEIADFNVGQFDG